jgi:uncharacterized protein
MPDSTLDEHSLAQIEIGVSQFNQGKFFECHDTLEDVWQGTRGPARDFLQGLIQIAVGFYHLDAGNLAGSRSQLEKGLARITPYPEIFLGIDLTDLRDQVQAWLRRTETGPLPPLPLIKKGVRS